MHNRPAASPNTDKNNVLIDAAKTGQVELCAALLAAGANVNTQSPSGSTPLLLAAQNGHSAIVRMLLAQGANQQITNSRGGFPAYLAAQLGRTECLRLLLDKGEDVNRGCPNDHATAVYIAAHKGQTDCVKLLLERGANPLLQCTDGEDAIYTAKQHNHTEIVSLLEAAASKFKTNTIKKEAPATKININDGKTPLTTALQSNQYKVALDLIRRGVDVISDVDLIKLYAMALRSDNAATFIELLTTLEAAQIPNDRIKNLLPPIFTVFNKPAFTNIKEVIYAQIIAEKDIAKRDALIKNAQDKNTWRGHILYLQRGYKQCDPNKGVLGRLAAFQANQQQLNIDLFYAAGSGDNKKVERLLAQGADPNYLHKNTPYPSITPLCIAAQNNHEKAIKLLIASGAKVNVKAFNAQTTPLSKAVQLGHINSVRVLLENNAEIDAENGNGSTALHVAASHNHAYILSLLLQYKPNLNKQNNDGITPLFRAAEAGDTWSVKSLLQHGADPLIASDKYGSPLDEAKRKGHSEIIKVLEEHIKQHAAVVAKPPVIEAAVPKTASVYPNLKEILAATPAASANPQTQSMSAHAAAAAFYDSVLPLSPPQEIMPTPEMLADPGKYFDGLIKHAGKVKPIDLTVKEAPVATVEPLLTFPAPAESLILFPEPVELLTLPSVDEYVFSIDIETAKKLPEPLVPNQLSPQIVEINPVSQTIVDEPAPVTTKSWLDELYALPPAPTHLIQHSIFAEKREEAAVVVEEKKKKEEKRQAVMLEASL